MHYLFLVALAFMLSLPVAAQDFEKAEEATQRGDYTTALREWRLLAEQGNAALAQFILGGMYEEGKGVPQDYAEAVRWYRMSAEQGIGVAVAPVAQYSLGVIYREGQGVPQDYVQALMWFSLAGAQGIRAAQKYRDELALQMTRSEKLEVKRLAREWMEKHGK